MSVALRSVSLLSLSSAKIRSYWNRSDSRGEKTGQAYTLEENVPVSDQRDSSFSIKAHLGLSPDLLTVAKLRQQPGPLQRSSNCFTLGFRDWQDRWAHGGGFPNPQTLQDPLCARPVLGARMNA